MSQIPPVLVSRAGAVGIIELARPDKFNCLSLAVHAALEAAFDEFEAPGSDVRAILICAQGKNFSTGADLTEVKAMFGDAAQLRHFIGSGHRLLKRLEASELPVVAACQGLSLAGGTELMLACDVVFAAKDARFGDQHAQFGLIPGWGGSQRLPRIVGLRRAMDLFFAARWIDADTALQWGLVNTVVEPDALRDAALDYCTKLATRSRVGIAAMKRLARQGLEGSLQAGLKMEEDVAPAALLHDDVKEGVRHSRPAAHRTSDHEGGLALAMSLRSLTQHDVIERNAHLHGSRTAFLLAGQRVTHADYARRVARLAAGLAAAGVRAGDRVAILAPNCLEYVDLFGAAAQLAAIVVPINWRLSAEEVAYVVEDVTPKVLLVSAELRALVPQVAWPGMLRYALGVGLSAWADVSELYVDGDTAPAELVDDTGFVIIHTAAVGGRPRGALLSHRGLMAASAQAQGAWRLTPTDVNLGVLPLFHVGGVGLMFAAQMAGAATLLLPRFDPESVVSHIDDDGGSLIGTFPPMLGALVDAAAGQGSALANLRVVTGIDSPDTIARLHAHCPSATFWTTYGQTETSGQVCMAPYDERPGSAGRPTVFNTLAVVDELDRVLDVGGTGEILVRGPMVFQGYWGRDEDNDFTMRNGWHHTGDLGHIDADGYLWYAGRSPAKELIKPGGENVYPGEVERAILEHPALAGAAVIGVPDKDWGEAVKAICVLRAGHSLNAEALIEFVGRRIARYKKPKHVVFVQALPLTAAGLPDRVAVKAEHGQPLGTS